MGEGGEGYDPKGPPASAASQKRLPGAEGPPEGIVGSTVIYPARAISEAR